MSTNWLSQLGGMLERYAGNQTPPPAEVRDHYEQAAQTVPSDQLSGALSSAFRSDQTPPFGQLMSTLFSRSNSDQKAGLLNTLLASGAGNRLKELISGFGIGGNGQVAPADAERLTPEQVGQMATAAESHDPTIVDRAGEFYAQHPTLVKMLGAAAMGVALTHLSQRR